MAHVWGFFSDGSHLITHSTHIYIVVHLQSTITILHGPTLLPTFVTYIEDALSYSDSTNPNSTPAAVNFISSSNDPNSRNYSLRLILTVAIIFRAQL